MSGTILYLPTPPTAAGTEVTVAVPDPMLWASGLADAGERLRALIHPGLTPNPGTSVPEAVQQDLRVAVAAHWNRLGLTPTDQQVLAVAIRNALWATGKP